MKGATSHALCFGGSDTVVQGYVDAHMEGDKYNTRITIWYVFIVGGTIISWISNLQKAVALSTTEVDYVPTTHASKEMIWLHKFMEELDKNQENSKLCSDSQSPL